MESAKIKMANQLIGFAAISKLNRVANAFFEILFLLHSRGIEGNNFRFLVFLQYYCASKE